MCACSAPCAPSRFQFGERGFSSASRRARWSRVRLARSVCIRVSIGRGAGLRRPGWRRAGRLRSASCRRPAGRRRDGNLRPRATHRSTRASLTTGTSAIFSSRTARVRAVSETSTFDDEPVVSALRPSVVSRTRETGAPPPTCTGRPSIPLILFAIAFTPGSSTSGNGRFLQVFSPGDDYLARILSMCPKSQLAQRVTRTTASLSAIPSTTLSDSRFCTRTRWRALASLIARPGARTSIPPALAEVWSGPR